MKQNKAKEQLHVLRWPDTNGEPVCPKCQEKTKIDVGKRADFVCHDCGKQFGYKTMTPLVFTQIEDWQILSLIESVKNEVKYVDAGNKAKVKADTARKWMLEINNKFSEGDDGNLYFPEPSCKYEHRKKERQEKKKYSARKITKRHVASYILKHKCVIMSQFRKEYSQYDLTGSEHIINSLLNKTREQLKLICKGKDPFEKETKEINNIQQKIYDEEKQKFDEIKIPEPKRMGIVLDKEECDSDFDYINPSSIIDELCRKQTE